MTNQIYWFRKTDDCRLIYSVGKSVKPAIRRCPSRRRTLFWRFAYLCEVFRIVLCPGLSYLFVGQNFLLALD